MSRPLRAVEIVATGDRGSDGDKHSILTHENGWASGLHGRPAKPPASGYNGGTISVTISRSKTLNHIHIKGKYGNAPVDMDISPDEIIDLIACGGPGGDGGHGEGGKPGAPGMNGRDATENSKSTVSADILTFLSLKGLI